MDEKQQPNFARQPVSLQQCRSDFFYVLGYLLVTSLLALYLFHTQDKFDGWWCSFFAIVSIPLAVMRSWRYVAARSGETVYYLNDKHARVVWLLVLTVIVTAWTYFTVWLVDFTHSTHPPVWYYLFIFASDGVCCIYTLFRWYRLLFRHPKAALPAEPQEGVWPPPPIRPDHPPT